MHHFSLPSFAKVNLILRIVNRRRDGYHSLQTLFQSLDLHDTLAFRFAPSHHFHVALDVQDSPIPSDGTNLIYKACRSFHEHHPLQHRVEVSIEKKIPVESGLGGGSSNAAVTLIALSRLYGWPLGRRTLLSIARQLGADVPFFLYGGSALGTARGDQISPLPDLWPETPVLLALPGVTCSTAVIYRKYDEAGLLTAGRNSIKILLDQRPESLRDFVSHFENDLEKVVFALYPELDSTKKRLVEQGAAAALLTGSGSALFGLFEEAADRDRASGAFPANVSTRFLSRREYRERLGLPGRLRRTAAGA
ncbi:MAG TPA: 4-(cytidine 5'-diphospho)-2-C-methyl-D-erythritol kinase [Acidobacteriota bacterium]|nr:4-(cytidine 5'-diphospho)-2-C-methyl-D-erythritol kinase [Acidobacteriota bacterium]